VIDRRTGVVEVTSQNHGFRVDEGTLAAGEFELTHWSGNDGTLEGMVHRKLPVLSCQYHPEASPGPHDSRIWFRAFADAIARQGRKRARPAHPGPGPSRPASARARAAAAGGDGAKGQR
jgi:carbamoyl-phosphate synthase small subunit